MVEAYMVEAYLRHNLWLVLLFGEFRYPNISDICFFSMSNHL